MSGPNSLMSQPAAKLVPPAEEADSSPQKFSADELTRILNEHAKWLTSEGKEGEQANLQGANLQGANLQGADLQGADLQGASLRDVKGLTQGQLNTACGDGDTQLPAHLTIGPCPEIE